jgi:hypothetical protein
MCPTVLGRIETRVFTLIGPALLATILSIATHDPGWIVTIGVFLLMGTLLDIVFYPVIIRWQPPWLTFVIAIGEFVLLVLLVLSLDPGNGRGFGWLGAIVLFWVSWVMAEATKIVIFPLLSLTWLESGGEFRATDWSIRPDAEPLPVLAAPMEGQAEAPLVRQMSGVGQRPERRPPLSGVHDR